VENGRFTGKNTIICAESFAEDVRVARNGEPFTGSVPVVNGRLTSASADLKITGKSLLHTAPLTTMAFSEGYLGSYGKYVVAIGLVAFAISSSLSWSYYGGRASVFLFGPRM